MAVPFRIRDTVLGDTPAANATDPSVTGPSSRFVSDRLPLRGMDFSFSWGTDFSERKNRLAGVVA